MCSSPHNFTIIANLPCNQTRQTPALFPYTYIFTLSAVIGSLICVQMSSELISRVRAATMAVGCSGANGGMAWTPNWPDLRSVYSCQGIGMALGTACLSLANSPFTCSARARCFHIEPMQPRARLMSLPVPVCCMVSSTCCRTFSRNCLPRNANKLACAHMLISQWNRCTY